VPLAAYVVCVSAVLHLAAGGELHITVAQGSVTQALDWQVHAIECAAYVHWPATQLPSLS